MHDTGSLITLLHGFPWGSTVSSACASHLTVCEPSTPPPTNKTGGGDGLAADYPISEDFYYTQADSPGHAVTSP